MNHTQPVPNIPTRECNYDHTLFDGTMVSQELFKFCQHWHLDGIMQLNVFAGMWPENVQAHFRWDDSIDVQSALAHEYVRTQRKDQTGAVLHLVADDT